MAGKKSGTRKKTGMSEFQKMVKALKLSKDEIADMLGHTRLNPETGMREHRKGGGKVVKAKFGTSGLLVKAAGKRSGQNLKGSSTSARRKWSEDPNVGVDGKVRASTDTADGPMKEVISGKNKSLQASPTAQRKRKAEGKQAADLKQPAAGSVGRGAEQADAGIAKFKIDAKKAKEYDKRIKELKKQVLKDRDIIRKLRKQKPTGVDRIKNSETIRKAKIKLEQNSLQLFDMKSRGGPGGKSKATEAQRKKIIDKIKSLKKGGPVVKARIGGILKAGKAIKKSISSGGKKPKKKTNPIEQIKKIRKKRPVRKPRKLGPVGSRDNAPINMGFMERAIRNQDIDTKDVQKLTPYQYKKMLEETPFQPKLKRRKRGAARKKAGGGPIIEKKFGKAITKALKKGTKSLKKATKKNPNIRNPIKKRGYNIFDRLQKHMTGPSGPRRNKKGGGKITYRMTGGQVVDAGYD
jgi:hypothetical protein